MHRRSPTHARTRDALNVLQRLGQRLHRLAQRLDIVLCQHLCLQPLDVGRRLGRHLRQCLHIAHQVARPQL